MVQSKYLALLDEFGADSHEHEKGSLRDHLIGTHDLLQEWGNKEYVALGGLFHSIYGTQYFRISSASLGERGRIAETIGRDAEQLAYLFCAVDRTGFIYEAGKPSPTLWDCVANELIEVTPQVVKNLVEIEAANFIEQRHFERPMEPRYVTMIRHTLERGGPYMSEKARARYSEVVQRTIEASL